MIALLLTLTLAKARIDVSHYERHYYAHTGAKITVDVCHWTHDVASCPVEMISSLYNVTENGITKPGPKYLSKWIDIVERSGKLIPGTTSSSTPLSNLNIG